MSIIERTPLQHLMKDCTVKITKPNGELLGTGFFVTPNKLATCLHVMFVGNRPKFKTFKLEGHDDEFPLNANFVLHEDADLLVIDLSKAVGEKCVNLKAGRNLEGQKLWAWTFNTSYPQGTAIVPVIKETAKVKSIEVFRVSLDAVFQGSSGTPVLNAETTDWFGVVYWMKERSDDALIVPAACFKDLFPDLFNENQQHHQETEYWSTARQRSISTKAHHLNIVPSISNKNVVGRTNDLAKLRKGLSEASNLLLMNGIGGIGKTTMAKLYTNNHGDEYDRVLWIEMEETPEQSFATDLGLQSSLGIRPEQGEDYGPVCYRMLHALQNMDGKNLMVLDNATENIRSIKDRLPAKKHWDILLTSRQVLQQFDIMELGKLDKESAKELFSRHCPKPQPDNALDAFLSKLEYHTLSIELFAKILTAHWEMETVDELSTYLDTNHLDDETLQSVVEVEHARGQTTLYRHLLQAFDLSGIEQVPELMRLLVQMAALPPNVEGYAVKDLMEWLGIEKEKTAFVNRLNKLHSLGWLVQPQTNHFGTHRLIKTIVSHARPASEQDLMPLVETFTQKLNLDQAKDNPVDKFRWIPFGQSVLLSVEHLEFDEKAILQNNLALVLKELGDYPRAKVLLEEAVKSNEQNFGPDHPATAVRYSNLAIVLQALGDYAGAKSLLEKALRSNEQNLGTNHPNTSATYSNLATVLQVLGDYKGAKALLEKAMKSDEQNFGPEHPETAKKYSNLAIVLQDLGDYQGAKELLEKAMISDEQNFGPEHPTTAVRYSNLALVLKDLEDYQRAKVLLEKAMKAAEQNFGPEHPMTAGTYSNLAMVLKDLGDYDGAKTLLEKALASAERNFGPDHPSTARTYSNLALVLQDLGDYAGAKALLEKALASDERNFGPDHPSTARTYSNLALVLQALGDYAGAKALLKKALASDERNFGPDHPTTAVSYSNLALVLQDLGDYAGAKALFEKAMASAERNFGEDHPTTAVRYSNLATVLKDLGDYDGAKGLLEKALASDERNFGEDHPTTAVSYSNLAGVLKDLGDYPGAKTLLEKAMASAERNFGEEHPTTAVKYTNFGVLLADMGDYTQARRYLRKALDVFQRHFGEEHPNTQTVVSLLKQLEALEKQNPPSNTQATPYLNAAQQHRAAGDYRAAIESYQKALPLVAQPAEVYNFIGLCHYYLKEYPQAIQHYEQSYQLDSTDAWIYLNNTGMAHAKSGNLEEAKRRFERLQALIPDEGLPYRDWCLYYALKGDTEQALDNLERAVALGYDNLEWIETEEALESLRGTPRYQALIITLRETTDK